MLLRVPLLCAATRACNSARAPAQAGVAEQSGLSFRPATIGLAQPMVFATSAMLALRASPSDRKRPASLAVRSMSLSVLSPPIAACIPDSAVTTVLTVPTAPLTWVRTIARASANLLAPPVSLSRSPPWVLIMLDASSSLPPTSPA